MTKKKVIEIDDILIMPDVTGPIAVQQKKKTELTFICPWCGAEVGKFRMHGAMIQLMLAGDNAVKKHVKMSENQTCRVRQSTVTLKMKRGIILNPGWDTFGVDVI